MINTVGLFRFYLDTVDTAALNNATSGRADGREAPILPLVAPWVVAGPALYFIGGDAQVAPYIFGAAMVIAIVGYASMMVYYYRAKGRYREGLGIPDWREKMRQRVEEDMAKPD